MSRTNWDGKQSEDEVAHEGLRESIRINDELIARSERLLERLRGGRGRSEHQQDQA